MAETRAIRRLGRSPVRHVIIHSGASCVTAEGQVVRTVQSPPACAAAPAAAAVPGPAGARETVRATAVPAQRGTGPDGGQGELVDRFILVRGRRSPQLN